MNRTEKILVSLMVIGMILCILRLGYIIGYRQGWNDHREAIEPSYLRWEY